MGAAKHRHGQHVRIAYGPLETARAALKFGREGGCSISTCELCLYRPLCVGGDVGEVIEETVNQDKEIQK
jgi:hypothetical protein